MNFENSGKGNLYHQIITGLKTLGWDVDFQKVLSLLKPCSAIELHARNQPLAIGESKFGGVPDLPEETIWPNINGIPFAFIGQINLCQERFDPENLLPKKGMLYFFVSLSDDNFQSFPLNELHKVIYHDGQISELSSRPLPPGYLEYAKFRESAVEFKPHYSLPSYQNFQIIKNQFTDDDQERLFEASEMLCELSGIKPDTGHQLLGNPDAIQGDVHHWWAFQDCLIAVDIDKKRSKQIQRSEKDYVLLLQVDLLDEISQFNRYGASGALYFGIKTNDLKRLNFDHTSFVLQNS
ncbi:MAG: DUF1963 domain-containing protein [Pedobacter sp.]|nr:MAG: DUF1963 domain-containing protein [Pedobacter sp.]